MERKLIDYLPPVVRGVAELRGVLAGQQPEFDRAWAEAAALMANQFFETMEDQGLRRWERMLKITPRGTDTLEIRRARVQAKFNLLRPYTLPWLLLWLAEAFGPENFSFRLEDYTAVLGLDYDAIPNANRLAAEILPSLLAILPENLLFEQNVQRQSRGALALGGVAEQSLSIEIWPRLVTQRESTGHLVTAALLETHQILDIPPNL